MATDSQRRVYGRCKPLVWSVRVRDSEGRDRMGAAVARVMVRSTTKTLRNGAVTEMQTSQALTRLAKTKIRQRYTTLKHATAGELLDETLQGVYGPQLRAIVKDWRKSGELITDLPDEAAFPLALTELARVSGVSRARLIAEAIHSKWGAELEQIAPELYGAPCFEDGRKAQKENAR